MLQHLLSAQAQKQPIPLLYITRMTIGHERPKHSTHECEAMLDTAKKNAPWLLERLSQLAVVVPELAEYQEEYRGPRGQSRNRRSYTPMLGPRPSFYQISSLIQFSNLRQLDIGYLPNFGGRNLLLWLINYTEGTRFFQKLEELRLGTLLGPTPCDVTTWRLLSNLKVIWVIDLRFSKDIITDKTVSNDIETAETQNSSLEYVVFLHATARVESIESILRTTTALRVFHLGGRHESC